MNTKNLVRTLSALFLCFVGITIFGQQTQTHKVDFSDIDGFTGYVNFTSSREGFATQLRGKNATLVLNNYRCTPEEKEALKKAGIDFWGYSGYSPKTFGVVVEGQAYIIEPNIKSNAIGKDKLQLNSNGIRGDFTTPEFAEDVKKRVNELQKQTKTSQWEKYGGFSAEKVTELYFSELKNEIDRILYTAKKEKEKAEKEKQEAEEKEKQEKTEQEKQEDDAKEAEADTASEGSGSGATSGSSTEREEKSGDNDTDTPQRESGRESTQTVYYPKSNRQLYDELKALTDATPALLNDPNIRSQLRSYKAFADRDDRNIRDYNTLEQTMGGGYHPAKITALNSIYQTNAKIANAEMGVGAAVDAATGLVGSIIEAKNRKEQQKLAANQRRIASHQDKVKAIKNWEYQLLEQRRGYEKDTKSQIEADFNLIETVEDLPITYETEKYIEKGYWDGHFEKATKTIKDWENDVTYKLYVVEMNGLYGILGDNGEILYPPQFEGIYAFNDAGKRPRFLVNIKDKWGEILADGRIAEEIKYDGIWYYANKESKILRQGNNWQEKSVADNRLVKQFSTAQIANLYAGGLIPISNTNLKKHNASGSYSLNSNGEEYVFGDTADSEAASMEYESVRRGQTIERLYKINGKWFITANYGAKNMTTIEMPQKFVVEALRETESGKKWGAINQDGEIVVPFEHKFIKRTASGFATDKGNYTINN